MCRERLLPSIRGMGRREVQASSEVRNLKIAPRRIKACGGNGQLGAERNSCLQIGHNFKGRALSVKCKDVEYDEEADLTN